MQSTLITLPKRLTRNGRRAALTMLLSAEAGNDTGMNTVTALYGTITELHGPLDEQEFQAAYELTKSLLKDIEKVDAAVQEISLKWRVKRMAPVDRNLLRLGVYEILNVASTEVRQTIIDYVQLGREFGERSTHAFVNGLLDQLCKNRRIPIK